MGNPFTLWSLGGGLTATRQPGQGGAADAEPRDLRAELLAAEAAHFAKTKGTPIDSSASPPKPAKRELEESLSDDDENEDPDAKRRRVLEETREIDADSEDDDDSESSEEESDEEDETAELMRELEKIKRERAEQKAREEAEQAKEAQDQREEDIALGNPLLNPKAFNVKRRWDDDVVFKNQARGTEQKGNKEFVNVRLHGSVDLLRAQTDVDTGSSEIGLPQKIHGKTSSSAIGPGSCSQFCSRNTSGDFGGCLRYIIEGGMRLSQAGCANGRAGRFTGLGFSSSRFDRLADNATGIVCMRTAGQNTAGHRSHWPLNTKLSM